MADLSRLAAWMIPHRNRIHVAMLLITVLMIPGALTALEPIDMESYNLDSPELEAEKVIEEEYADAEVILGFTVVVKDPKYVDENWVSIPSMSDGAADYSSLPPTKQMIASGEEWGGIEAPAGGIINLSILREIDAKANLIRTHPLSSYMKPMVNDVTGLSTDGIMSITDIFRGFMNNQSILTKPGMSLSGPKPPKTNWSDCGVLQCLEFDDENLTQDHIDLAANRMALNSDGNFLRWMSLDRGFRANSSSGVIGPIGGKMLENNTFADAMWGPGRWSGSSTWLLVQLDRRSVEEAGWTFSWKDAKSESEISWGDEGFRIGGYRLVDGELVIHAPSYDSEFCSESEKPCSVEWSMMEIEGMLRSEDQYAITLLVGQAINVEVNRELQSSAGLILLMGLVVLILLYASLRRISDVVIVSGALGLSLLWMQGFIGHASSISGALGFQLISRSQFSNLLPILVIALGIDDSLHALHRYKEERRKGADLYEAGNVTLARVGRAIMLTSLTTIAAFSANLFSDVAALRSFGLEAAFGILCAFLLTGLWVPLIRLSWDEWLESRGKSSTPQKGTTYLIPEPWLRGIARSSGEPKNAIVIALLALLITLPAAIGMSKMEGDFAVENFLDAESDFAFGVNLVNERFSDEGEPGALLIEGDILDPRVHSAINKFRNNMDDLPEGVPDKITRKPTGKVDILALDEIVDLATVSMMTNPQPFYDAGFNQSECTRIGSGFDLEDRDCLSFFYGFTYLNGVPPAGAIPEIPPTIVSLYIVPDVELNSTSPWLDVDGNNATYSRMIIRFGITSPEDFKSMRPGMKEIEKDMSPFINLTSGDWRERGGESDEDHPLTWVIPTGKPVTRFVASEAMNSEMQSGLLLGSLFVIITLMIGFKSIKQAIITTIPILMVVVWLYGLMWSLGYSLNIVTVTIATISLGVGIDYCIHVSERYREGRKNGENHKDSLEGVGGACGLALVGSAASDVTGFAIIALSPMGLFSAFGLFSAAMIMLSLIASLVLTTAAIGLFLNDSTDAVHS